MRGQTGYTSHILDGIIDRIARQIFSRVKSIPKHEILSIGYQKQSEEQKAILRATQSEYNKAAKELKMLRGEVVKAIQGQSTFSKELLGSLIAEAEDTCCTAEKELESARQTFEGGEKMRQALTSQYDEVISWSDMYDTAGMEVKKMIVNCLIRRVDVYEGYRLKIEFGISLAQFGLQMPTQEIDVATA